MTSRPWFRRSSAAAQAISVHATEVVVRELERAGELAGELVTSRAGAVRAEDPDRDILDLVHAGDLSTALRRLMHRHGTEVYRYCRMTLRDTALADDVHQQVFIQAHRDLARFAELSTLRTWLFAIARHRVLDAAKSRRRALVHIEERDVADAPDLGPAPDERIDDARLHEALMACFAELGEHLRTAVMLRYQQGFTFEDMADVCHEKPGTLQARVMRALPKLRACIEARTKGRL
jgi:RNA polymerase sigma factor (sigma-70 family)